MAVVITFPEYKNFSKAPLLLQAVAANRLDEVETLLIQGDADVNYKDQENYSWDMTPLLYAAKWGHVDIVRLLIKAGADLRAVDRTSPRDRDSDSKLTALHLAAPYSAEVVAILIAAGADVHARTRLGRTPLISANAESTVLLLEAGARVNVRSKEGVTPIYAAVVNDDLTLTKRLLEAGANVALAEKGDHGLLESSARSGNWAMFDLLLTASADVNALNLPGNSALHAACSKARTNFVRELLLRGALVNTLSWEGCTALDLTEIAMIRSQNTVRRGLINAHECEESLTELRAIRDMLKQAGGVLHSHNGA